MKHEQMAFLDTGEHLGSSRSEVFQIRMGEKQQSQHKTQSHSASEQSPGGNIPHPGLMLCNFSAIFPTLSSQLAALAKPSITRKLYKIMHFSNKWHSSCLAN